MLHVPAIRRTLSFVAAAAVSSGSAALAQQSRPLVPEHVTVDGAAQAAMSAAWLTDDERRTLRVFHGVWDERDLTTIEARAMVALQAWKLDAPVLRDPAVPVTLRAEALERRGELQAAIDLLADDPTLHAARIRAEAAEQLGDLAFAARAAEAPIVQLLTRPVDDPADLTDGVRALMVRARIQGQPARDYQAMIALLSRAHQELDRLYWPARLAEADLLTEKDNHQAAAEALHETLRLNPRESRVWFMLGRMALRRFDFDSVELAAAKLRRLNTQHPLASLLDAEMLLIRDDPDAALDELRPLLERYPAFRPALALVAAAQAQRYDDEALALAMARYEALSPGSAEAHYVVGRHLSLNRQYGDAAEMLGEAIRRKPAWPAPQIELGLMELQSGRDGEAMRALEAAAELDPFNQRALNSLRLLQELAGYETVESEHFVIRYKPGIDQVMVDLMVEPLEQMHATVAGRFRHEPDRKTTIEVLPDHERFAVRITGMPWIHTIAASTGPVIAMEVPREGPAKKHQGTFDWPRVLQHEYTHTITLSQTRNRIPHWLTEAAAVGMELSPRDYVTCEMLANAYLEDELFDFDEIKWAFVRPKRPGDRALAYAQGHWMLEFMTERFGASSLIRLLELYFDGRREPEAMREALGMSREQFLVEFLDWAGTQVTSWGLNPEPSLEVLTDELRWADPESAEAMRTSLQTRLDVIAQEIARRIGQPVGPRGRDELTAEQWPDVIRPRIEVDDPTLAQWLAEHPDHPDLLELSLRRRLRDSDEPDDVLMDLLERYSAARPADPFPHKQLARILLDSDTPELAIPHLEHLDAHEQKTPVYAVELANQYRRTGDLERALAKATRACRIDPYDADRREAAAAICLQLGRLEDARTHIVALTLIEPDRPQHGKRLEAVERLIGQRQGRRPGAQHGREPRRAEKNGTERQTEHRAEEVAGAPG